MKKEIEKSQSIFADMSINNEKKEFLFRGNFSAYIINSKMAKAMRNLCVEYRFYFVDDISKKLTNTINNQWFLSKEICEITKMEQNLLTRMISTSVILVSYKLFSFYQMIIKNISKLYTPTIWYAYLYLHGIARLCRYSMYTYIPYCATYAIRQTQAKDIK